MNSDDLDDDLEDKKLEVDDEENALQIDEDDQVIHSSIHEEGNVDVSENMNHKNKQHKPDSGQGPYEDQRKDDDEKVEVIQSEQKKRNKASTAGDKRQKRSIESIQNINDNDNEAHENNSQNDTNVNNDTKLDHSFNRTTIDTSDDRNHSISDLSQPGKQSPGDQPKIYNNKENLNLENNIDSINWMEDLNEELDYDHDDYQTIKQLNYFEIINLNNNFNNLEFIQVNLFNNTINTTMSNSFRLRKIIWHSIKSDYLQTFPNFNQFNVDNTIIPKFKLVNFHIVLPNDKLTLLLLFSQYLLKTLNDHETNDNLNLVFKVIKESMVTDDIKRLWQRYFRWMLV